MTTLAATTAPRELYLAPTPNAHLKPLVQVSTQQALAYLIEVHRSSAGAWQHPEVPPRVQEMMLPLLFIYKHERQTKSRRSPRDLDVSTRFSTRFSQKKH